MSDTINMQFKLKGVELLKTQINAPVLDFAPKEFQFDLSLESRIESTQKLIMVAVTADVRSDNKTEKLATVSSVCIFGIENFDQIVKISPENHFETSDEVMFVLISISFSTLRGIMFEQFRGTYLHTAILPIIDPKQFVLQKIVTQNK